jgi:hypothetical protein
VLVITFIFLPLEQFNDRHMSYSHSSKGVDLLLFELSGKLLVTPKVLQVTVATAHKKIGDQQCNPLDA